MGASAATLCSFRRFRDDKDVPLDDMDSDMMMAYEAYLKNNGVSPNSSSFYMRNLRAVYNRAVEKGLTSQRFPFKHVYTGVEKTVKRAVPLKVIKRIKEMDFSMNPSFDFARDMFLASISRYVIRGYGIPAKKGFAEWCAFLSQTQNGAATLHQMGEVYAGDCG